jgi:F-type H+-transporting ATPase subunit b
LVNINFTLIAETGLFLVFLWLMYAYVLRPLLKVMDERAAQVAEDEAAAENLESEYQETERGYRLSLAGIHQRAAQRVAEAKREAQARNNEEIHALKAAGAERMSALLKQVREDMRQQRAASDQVVAEIKGTLAEKLGFGKGQS